MKQPALIPNLQADALVREVEQQLRSEAAALLASARQQAQALLAQARSDARARMHQAVTELRRETVTRRARAQAQRDVQARTRAQQQAQRVVHGALPLLRELLQQRWCDARLRRQWIGAAIDVASARLRGDDWTVEHGTDWGDAQCAEVTAAVGARRAVKVSFAARSEIDAGLRIRADHAVLDATPAGLLADQRTVAAMLFHEIGREAP